eukprot:TRINITY_DN2375_c0_g1_i1.p1 TRINITY_DN2375_c0_g1~~TRINITY_DN2375_c0_g1_i1.p1  ORF type:complete len:751 (+),score=145.62 TRINITY_DN2375_c0_g1_i1:35-2287(+)
MPNWTAFSHTDMQYGKPARRFGAEFEWMPTLSSRPPTVQPEALNKASSTEPNASGKDGCPLVGPLQPALADVLRHALIQEDDTFLEDAAWVQENWGGDNDSEGVAEDSDEEDWSLAPGIIGDEMTRSKAAKLIKTPIASPHAPKQPICATGIRDSAESCPKRKGSRAGRLNRAGMSEENLPAAPVRTSDGENSHVDRNDHCLVKNDSSQACPEPMKIPNGLSDAPKVVACASNMQKYYAAGCRSQKVRVHQQRVPLEVQVPGVVPQDEAEKGEEKAGAQVRSTHSDAEDLQVPNVVPRKMAGTEDGSQHSTPQQEELSEPARRKVRFHDVPEVVNIESSAEVAQYESFVAKLVRDDSTRMANWGFEVEDAPEGELVLTGSGAGTGQGDFITAINCDTDIHNMKVSLRNNSRSKNIVTFERRATDRKMTRKRQALKNADCEETAEDSEHFVRSSEDDCSEDVQEKKSLQVEDLHGDVDSAEDTDSESAAAQGAAEPPDVVEAVESRRVAKTKSCPQPVRASPNRTCDEPRAVNVGRTWCAKNIANRGGSSRSQLGKQQAQSLTKTHTKKHALIWKCTSCSSLVKQTRAEEEKDDECDEDEEEEGTYCEPCWEIWEAGQLNTEGAEEEDEISAFLLSITSSLMALQGEEPVPALERIAERLEEARPEPLAVERVAVQMWSYIPKDCRLASKKGSGLLRYKSSLCITWFEGGSCTNARCTFAHGTSELASGPAWQRLAAAVKAMQRLCQQNAS